MALLSKITRPSADVKPFLTGSTELENFHTELYSKYIHSAKPPAKIDAFCISEPDAADLVKTLNLLDGEYQYVQP